MSGFTTRTPHSIVISSPLVSTAVTVQTMLSPTPPESNIAIVSPAISTTQESVCRFAVSVGVERAAVELRERLLQALEWMVGRMQAADAFEAPQTR